MIHEINQYPWHVAVIFTLTLIPVWWCRWCDIRHRKTTDEDEAILGMLQRKAEELK